MVNLIDATMDHVLKDSADSESVHADPGLE